MFTALPGVPPQAGMVAPVTMTMGQRMPIMANGIPQMGVSTGYMGRLSVVTGKLLGTGSTVTTALF